VNRWVTGDMLLSADATLRLLLAIRLDTRHGGIDQLICSLVSLFTPEIERIMRARDEVLLARARRGSGSLDDPALEVLSEVQIDLDQVL
jgi:hypothetical protein